jgi:hypothetical protein
MSLRDLRRRRRDYDSVKWCDAQIGELKQMLNPGAAAEPAVPAPPKRKRRLSAAGRKAIGDAARKRWAAVKAAKAQAAPAVGPKRAGRKRRRAKA